ncbi:MAG: histidine kinase [Dinghuibacter sp.]|nr:histidine kinase [Dinghuibacter sp.]
MKHHTGLFLLCLFTAVCGAIPVCAQNIPLQQLHIRHITAKDGLLFNDVQCFLQDSRQFLWMAGKALQRYDGYRFKNYFTGAEQMTTYTLFEDRQQHIWAGTNRGVFRLNRITDRFELYQDSLLTPGRKLPLNVYQITDDGSGRVWFCIKGHNAFLNPLNGRIETAAGILGFDAGAHPFLSRDADGNLWIRSSREYGIVRYNWRTGTCTTHENNPTNEPVFNIRAKDVFVYPDSHGNTWFTGGFDNRNLYRYHTAEKKLYTYILLYPPGYSKGVQAVPGKIISDRQGNIWVQMHEHQGVARYNAQADAFEYLYANNDKKNALHDAPSFTNSSQDFYEDRQGNFWYGGNGVHMFSPGKQLFQSVAPAANTTPLPAASAQPGFHSPANSFLRMPNGKIYVGFYGDGLWRFSEDMQPEQKIPLPTGTSVLIWNIFSPNGEEIFVADQSTQLQAFHPQQNTWRAIKAGNLPALHISASYVEPNGTVWLGFYHGGIYQYHPQTSQGTSYRSQLANALPKTKTVFNIVPENDEQLWLGTDNGVHLFSRKEAGISCSYYPGTQGNSDALNRVYHISRLNMDTLFLSTAGGFVVFNTKTKSATVLNMNNGLPDNSCFSSLPERNKQFVWINSQNKGLCRLNLRTLRPVCFTDIDGIDDPSGDMASYMLPNGRFLFSNINGFFLFHPDSVSALLPRNGPVITGLQVNGRDLYTGSEAGSNMKLELNRHENTLGVFFSALDFFNNERITYSVHLSGADTGWVFIGNKPQVEYRNLPPGRYTLQVKCNNEWGNETGNIATLQFTISPPFWKKWWFYLLVSLLLAALVYLYYRYRVYAIRKEEQLKSDYRQQMTELEIKALRSQMNPHFIFNSLNAINRYILKNDKQEASAYLTKFSKLVRMILDHSRQSKIPLLQELDALQLYLELERLRFRNNFSYNILVHENISSGVTFIPPMVIQPFAENAIWHGLLPKKGDCHLEIEITATSNMLLCRVEDNGIGRQGSASIKEQQSIKRSSLGITATEQRLQLITEHHKNASVTIEDLYTALGEPAGTRVWIHIPYSFS